MERIIKISKGNYVKAALSVANCFLNMTPLEIDMIATMLNHGATSVTSASRRMLMNSLNKSKFVIANNIKRLKRKSVLVEDDSKKTVVNPTILTYIQNKEFKVKFEIYENDNSKDIS